MKDLAYFNGELSSISEMRIPMNDRAVFFGDGIYEVAFVRNKRCFALEDHLDRFYNSCQLLEITPPMPREELSSLLLSLVEKLDESLVDICLYFHCTRGTAPRSHAFPLPAVPSNLLVYANGFQSALGKEFRLVSEEDKRFGFCNIKSLNLIPNVLATQRAAEAGCDECVLYRGEYVTECAHSGLSILKNGRLITTPLSEWILPSITRKHLIAVCNNLGIPVDERHYTMEELMEADEVIVTSSLTLFSRVYEVDGVPVGGHDMKNFEIIDRMYMDWFNSETAS